MLRIGGILVVLTGNSCSTGCASFDTTLVQAIPAAVMVAVAGISDPAGCLCAVRGGTAGQLEGPGHPVGRSRWQGYPGESGWS